MPKEKENIVELLQAVVKTLQMVTAPNHSEPLLTIEEVGFEKIPVSNV